MWCGGCYEFTKGWKLSGGDREEESERRYERGSSGYNLLTQFQCEKCYFRNIQGRYPDTLSEKDMRLLVMVRIATLDEFWIRETGTVKGNLTMVKCRTRLVWIL